MFGIGAVELIILGILTIGGGVAALVVISLALANRKKPNQD